MDPIEELLTRGVDKIIPSKEELEQVLRSGKKLRLYTGIDPTGTLIHIGHTAWMWKLRAFQDLGHEVIVLIGDFTGMIGDPSGKSEARKLLTEEEISTNAKTYKEQIGKIIHFDGPNPATIRRNSEWHAKMSALEAARNMSYLTFAQVIERDMFQERLKKGQDLFLNEFMYPYLQGYDSVAMDVDLEVGGSDQLFNMLTGRDLMHKMKRKNKFVMGLKLVTDASGKKIGKTEGNAIAICGQPNTLFGQIMSLPDETISAVFESATNVPMAKVDEIKSRLASKENPINLKKELAWQIVCQYNDPQTADSAKANFESTIQSGQVPADIPEFTPKSNQILDILTDSKLASSKSEARRLIDQHGVKIDQNTVSDYNTPVTNGSVISVGPLRHLKIK